MDCRGSIPGRGNEGIFFSSPLLYRQAFGATQPPIQWIPGARRSGCETDHSPTSSNRLRLSGAIPPLHIRLHGTVLKLSEDTSS
jgi:hypothetical protein